jgi:hypothetical protein
MRRGRTKVLLTIRPIHATLSIESSVGLRGGLVWQVTKNLAWDIMEPDRNHRNQESAR